MKLQTAAALSASGYFCSINVRLSATAEGGLADVTDVDVLALRHDVTFVPHHVAVSCKSGNAPVAKEVFYLRGVIEYLSADQGLALFAFTDIDQHLRDLGRQLNIVVLNKAEGERWRRALTNGLPDPGYFETARHAAYLKAFESLGPENALNQWLKTDYWFYRDFRNLPRGIQRLRAAADRFAGKADWQAIVLFDVAAHLSLTILDLCRTICTLGLASAGDTTSAYLFGGFTSYRPRKELYSRVMQVLRDTGVLVKGGPMLPPLEPAYTPALAELAIRFIDRPHAAVRVPQILQDAMWAAIGADGLSFDDSVNGIAGQKLAQDLVDFVRAATGLTWMPAVLKPAAQTPTSVASSSSPSTNSAVGPEPDPALSRSGDDK